MSQHIEALEALESSNWLTNYGPVNTRLEQSFITDVFDGVGACTTFANATLGLMAAIKLAGEKTGGKGRYVIMPSFTFAAAAQAVLWAGLTPLLVDIDPSDWTACRNEEERLLRQHGEAIAALMPYATFGASIDLARYEELARRYGVAVVVDAASSLGALDDRGLAFGIGFPHVIVFSMHATKAFGVGEAALVYSGDAKTIETLRCMANFGFGADRSATMPGLNGKLSEIAALSTLIKLPDLDRLIAHRAKLAASYVRQLPDFTPQMSFGTRNAYQFMPLLMPRWLAGSRDMLQARLTEAGVGSGHYFSPHIMEQPYFRTRCVAGALPVTEALAQRMISLPMSDVMDLDDVARVCKAVRRSCDELALSGSGARITRSAKLGPTLDFGTVIVGGGPAALAPLVSASREGRLDALLARGLAIVERGPTIGAGQLGAYGISSDSTADTFMTAVLGHADPRLGTLAEHPLCEELQRIGSGPVPLVKAAALMGMIGALLHKAVVDAGGVVLVGHEAVSAQQDDDGRWHTRVRRIEDGAMVELRSGSLLLATGGHQAPERLTTELVGGQPLLPTYVGKVIHSDAVLRIGGPAALAQRLVGRSAPKIVVVGGSTSALATAGALLQGLPEQTRAPGAVTVAHRRPLRVFYRSAADALAEGYDDFGPDDICPISGFVYRLAGFRTESRELLMRAAGIGGRPAEPRLALHRIHEGSREETRALLERADVIVAAIGYRPCLLPVFGSDGHAIEIGARKRNVAAVDRECRILDTAGRPIERLFGIGLAAGFLPSGAFGGEPSFSGQANGLWLWQTAVGSMLVDSLMQAAPEHRHRLAQFSFKPQRHTPGIEQEARDADDMLLLHCGSTLYAANAFERDPGAGAPVPG